MSKPLTIDELIHALIVIRAKYGSIDVLIPSGDDGVPIVNAYVMEPKPEERRKGETSLCMLVDLRVEKLARDAIVESAEIETAKAITKAGKI